MKFFTALSFFLVSCSLVAQDLLPEETPSRFKIGITASADYCYRSLIEEDTTAVGYGYWRNFEIRGLGYSAGITTAYQLNQNWSLDAGLKYTLHRYRTVEMTLTDAAGNEIGSGYFAVLNRFISLPVGIHRSFAGGNRIGFIGGISIIPQYTLGVWTRGNYDLSPAYDNIDSYSEDKITKYNQFTVAGSVEAGVNMSFDKLCVQALPNFTYNFMKQAQEVKINRRLWSAGLEIRLLYSI